MFLCLLYNSPCDVNNVQLNTTELRIIIIIVIMIVIIIIVVIIIIIIITAFELAGQSVYSN
jgi:hypothetical protein